MEKKTIGGFISALRKANGMTQRELAEKLNVSDKSVSRWERDEGAPDLSLIPVIAEVFGVTCDELLRGERTSPESRADLSCNSTATPKGEKQQKRLFAVSLSKYKLRTYIAAGISFSGLIAAMIGNFGFLRAYIGFLAGAVFFLVGIICQAAFINRAFLSVSDDSLPEEETGKYKKSVIMAAERCFGMTAVLFAFTLPLAVVPHDTCMGVTAETLFKYGLLFSAAALVIFAVVCYFLNASLLKNGTYTLGEKESEVYRHNHAFKRHCAFVLVPLLLVTFIAHMAMTEIWGPWSIMEGTVFNDYESFVEFMEQDIPYSHSGPTVAAEPAEPVDGTYYDINGMEISKEEALTRVIRVDDGSEEGKVVCQYMALNQNVCSIRYQSGESALPITVFTYDDLRVAEAKASVRNVIFGAVYFIEAASVLIFYFIKRAK